MVADNVSSKVQESRKLDFPTWKSLIFDVLEINIPAKGNDVLTYRIQEIEHHLERLNFAKQSIKNFHPVQIIQTLALTSDSYVKDEKYQEYYELFKRTCISPNHFYSVYDIAMGWHSEVDENIINALGIEVDDFSLKAMAGLDPLRPLYHQDDVNHMIRWASIAYVILAFQSFSWVTLKDYYYAAYRVGTANSRIKEIRDRKYVVLEKRCYPYFHNDNDGIRKPIFHFDQWSVLDAEGYDYFKPKWITSSDQTDRMNGLFYLLNAYLLDIPMKYIVMLNERANLDRNKAIANSLNEKVLKLAGIRTDFEEIQIANSLLKTIRPKVANCMNLWDKRKGNNLVKIESDLQAVHYAKMLGLIPIPSYINELVFSNITSH